MKIKKRNNKYWQKRFENLEESVNKIGLESYRQVEPAFNSAQRAINSEIEGWYARIANNNEITLIDAKKLLSKSELKEFRWTLKDYIKYGEENAVDSRWIRELENASAKFHITRLEALKIRTQQQLEVAFGNELDVIDDMAAKVITNGYYHSCYELSRGLGVGFDIASIDERKLNLLKNKPWATDGKNFSSRIWNNKTKMVNDLHNELTKNCLLGQSPDKAIKNMTNFVNKKMKNAKSHAGRLVMTEQAYFSALSQQQAFNELDVEEFEVVATLDTHTSEVCRMMDGHHYPMKDYEVGVTAPPFHPYCRSCTCPYFDDEFTIDEKRVARDENGNMKYVSADMRYDDWHDKYVKTKSEYSLKEKMYKNRFSDDKQYNKYVDILGDSAPETLEEFKEIKYNDGEWEMFKSYTSSIKLGELTPLTDFNLYKKISEEMDEKLIGSITSNGITITGKSNHSISRVIGSVEQKRNGVQVTDVLDALIRTESEVFPIRTLKNGRSQKFRNKNVEVSINPDTGNIIQVNPVHKRKKVKS